MSTHFDCDYDVPDFGGFEDEHVDQNELDKYFETDHEAHRGHHEAQDEQDFLSASDLVAAHVEVETNVEATFVVGDVLVATQDHQVVEAHLPVVGQDAIEVLDDAKEEHVFEENFSELGAAAAAQVGAVGEELSLCPPRTPSQKLLVPNEKDRESFASALRTMDRVARRQLPSDSTASSICSSPAVSTGGRGRRSRSTTKEPRSTLTAVAQGPRIISLHNQTPEVLRKARKFSQVPHQAQAGHQQEQQQEPNQGDLGDLKSRFASIRRQAAIDHLPNGRAAGPMVTSVAPFSFATNDRLNKRHAKPSHIPMVADQQRAHNQAQNLAKGPKVLPRMERRARSAEPGCTRTLSSNVASSNDAVKPRARSKSPKPFSFVEKEMELARKKAAREADKPVNFQQSLRAYDGHQSNKGGGSDKKKRSISSFVPRQRSRSVDIAPPPSSNQANFVRNPSDGPVAAPKPQAPYNGVHMELGESKGNHKSTKMRPFSFAERDRVLMERKQQRIEEAMKAEKSAKEFKANPVPDFIKKKPGIPPPLKQPLLPTKPKPFAMNIEKRVESRVTKFRETLQAQMQKEREAANFKARPAKVLDAQPFKPKPAEKPLTEIHNKPLNLDVRAKEREAYEAAKKDREHQKEEAKRELEEQRKMREEEERRRLRKSLVHKPLPVRHFAPVKVGASKPFTVPITPRFSKKQERVLSKENNSGAAPKV